MPISLDPWTSIERTLVVVTGAGASTACATDGMWVGRPSPLVKTLFDVRHMEILTRHPLVLQASAELRREARTAISLESFLAQRYRDAEHELDRRKFAAIPLYLQHLLFDVSRNSVLQADNYDLLVAEVLRLPSVVFLTLNYDTLLDDRLALDAPLLNLDAYCDDSRNWGLVKLHGSVDWGRQLAGPHPFPWHDPPANPAVVGSIEKLSGASVEELRESGTFAGPSYPALSVPLGPDDEVNCPSRHVEFLRRRLANSRRVDLLVIGYSGYDREALNLLAEFKDRIATIYVVNVNAPCGAEVMERVSPHLDHAFNENLIWPGDFETFVQEDGLTNYLRLVRAPG